MNPVPGFVPEVWALLGGIDPGFVVLDIDWFTYVREVSKGSVLR